MREYFATGTVSRRRRAVMRATRCGFHAASEQRDTMAVLMTSAVGTSLSSVRSQPFGDRVRDDCTNRPPEIAGIVDDPRAVEPNDCVGGLDHGVGWDGQRFQEATARRR